MASEEVLGVRLWIVTAGFVLEVSLEMGGVPSEFIIAHHGYALIFLEETREIMRKILPWTKRAH